MNIAKIRPALGNLSTIVYAFVRIGVALRFHIVTHFTIA